MFSATLLAAGDVVGYDTDATAQSGAIAQGGDQSIVFEGTRRSVPTAILNAPMMQNPTLWNTESGTRANVHARQFTLVVNAACSFDSSGEASGLSVYPITNNVDPDDLDDIDVEYDKTSATFSKHPNGYLKGVGSRVTVSVASLTNPKPFWDRIGRCLGTLIMEGLKGEDTVQFGTLRNNAIKFVSDNFLGSGRHLYLVNMPSVYNAAWTIKNSGWTVGFAASTSGYAGDSLGSAYTGASVGSGSLIREGRPGGAWVLIEMIPDGESGGVVIDFTRILKQYDTMGVENVVNISPQEPTPVKIQNITRN